MGINVLSTLVVTLGAGGTAGTYESGGGGAAGGTSSVRIGGDPAVVQAGGGEGGFGFGFDVDGAGSAGGAGGTSSYDSSPSGSGENPTGGGTGGAPDESGEGGSITVAIMFGDDCRPDGLEFILDSAFEGTGSLDDPFQIWDEVDLQAMSGCTFSGKHLALMRSITVHDPWPVKDGSPGPLSGMRAYYPDYTPFEGHFDGQDFTITFDLPAEQLGQGVFLRTRGATIENLTIEAAGQAPDNGSGWLVNMDNAEVCADPDPSARRTQITNVHVIVGHDPGNDAATGIATFGGGLVGSACFTEIATSSVSGDATAYSVGGIVGANSMGVVIDRSRSALSLRNLSGGLVGPNSLDAAVTSSFSTGPIGINGGGIIGPGATNAQVTNAYTTGDIGDSSGGIVGASARSVTVDNVYTTGSIATGAGGIIGALDCSGEPPCLTDPVVTVTHAYVSGASTHMGVIFADNTLLEASSGAFSGTYNTYSLSSGFDLFFFSGSRPGWDNLPPFGSPPSPRGTIWSLGGCEAISSTLPYLTAMYTRDPCAPAEPTPTPTSTRDVGSGDQTTVNPSPIPSASATTTAPPVTSAAPTGTPIEVGMGMGAALVGGVAVPVTRSAGQPSGAFTLSAGGVTAGANPPPSGFSAGGTTTVTMSGLAPDSQVGTFLYSTPVALGTLAVGADGVAKGKITIPASVPPGNHTLQFTGWTPSNQPVILSAGITVKPQVTRVTTTVGFAKDSTKLTKASRAIVSRFVAESAALSAPVHTVVSYPKADTKAEVKLAMTRAKAVARALRADGMPGRITVQSVSPARKPGLPAGKVRITATG